MRSVLQRVSSARVHVEGRLVASIGIGFVALVGVGLEDGVDDASWTVEKVAGLRVFADEAGKMNLSVSDVGGGVIVVSQFTLLADVSRGRRPSFVGAARPEAAEPLVEAVAAGLQARGIEVGRGEFGAHMDVALVNDGPVTIVLDSRAR